jgi:hypothetical protein
MSKAFKGKTGYELQTINTQAVIFLQSAFVKLSVINKFIIIDFCNL